MKCILCLDDHNGMMFNHRRLSQDAILREDLSNTIGMNNIVMNAYSAKMFNNENITIEEVPSLNEERYQFIEDCDLKEYEDQIDELIIYYWNRKYPSDLKFTIDLNTFNCLIEREFVGNSHEKITVKTYKKREE